jgi:hypothetical protein
MIEEVEEILARSSENAHVVWWFSTAEGNDANNRGINVKKEITIRLSRDFPLKVEQKLQKSLNAYEHTPYTLPQAYLILESEVSSKRSVMFCEIFCISSDQSFTESALLLPRKPQNSKSIGLNLSELS